MLKNKKVYFVIGVLFLCFTSQMDAQNQLNSPYSRFGMGDLMPRASTAVTSMGGTGYTYQSPTAINFSNPASYIAFDTLSFLMDASFSWKNHTLVGSTGSGSSTQRGNTINFNYLSCGLSIQKWWKTAFGIQPYSIMNYTVKNTNLISIEDSLTQNLSYFGQGGINEVFWGNAFQLFKNFSLGVNASFLFGTYSKNRSIEWSDNYSFNTQIENSNRIRGAIISAGVQYFIPVKEKGELGLGFVYTAPIPIQSKGSSVIATYWGSGFNTSVIDSLYPKEEIIHSHKMPAVIGGGLSWGKKDKYYIGVDFTWENWSKYAVDNVNDSLSDSYKISLGGYITPNHLSAKYFPRMTFSLGANIEQTRLLLDGEQLNRFGINFGFLFPLKRTKTGFGLTLEYGQLGTTKLIKENYFVATFNVRIHERWYQRRKLD